MHTLFAAFFALIFSFGHAQSLRQVEAMPEANGPMMYSATAPTRQELALTGCTDGYSGSACPSQPMPISTTVSWNAHSNSRDQPSDSPRPTPPSAAF